MFVFVGEQYVSLAILNSNHMFIAVSVYNFESNASEQDKYKALHLILHQDSIAQQHYSRTDIIWCNKQSIITPQQFFARDESAAALNLVYGDAAIYNTKNDLVLKHQVYNVYRVDAAVDKLVADTFNTAVQWHQYSLLLNFAAATENLLYCNFNAGNITVMLRKQQQLQMVQTFAYSTPQDAAYHLLNICKSYSVNVAEMVITASGMIDESSILYAELHKYFTGIEFLPLPPAFEYCDEITNYPAHYFSHIFTTAACVL